MLSVSDERSPSATGEENPSRVLGSSMPVPIGAMPLRLTGSFPLTAIPKMASAALMRVAGMSSYASTRACAFGREVANFFILKGLTIKTSTSGFLVDASWARAERDVALSSNTAAITTSAFSILARVAAEKALPVVKYVSTRP